MNKLHSRKVLQYAKKLKVIELMGGVCQNCSECSTFKLCLHHIDKSNKEFEWCKLREMRWNLIINEISKCILLCHNCHCEFHYNDIPLRDDLVKRRKGKELMLSYKGSYCTECGYNKCVAALDFHHLDDKTFSLGNKRISVKANNDLPIDVINEIKKCSVLCKNCHMCLNVDIDFFNKNIDKIKEKKDNIKTTKKHDHTQILELFNRGKGIVEISKILNIGKGMVSWIVKNKLN